MAIERTPMNGTTRSTRSRTACLPGLALLVLVSAMALAPLPAYAGSGKLCDNCIPTDNDTAFTPGKTAMTRLAMRFVQDPAVSFVGTDGVLRCALPAPPGWQIQTVDPNGRAAGLSMALDDLGEPMIGYHDGAGALRFARHTTSGWSLEVVDANERVGGVTSMVHIPGGAAIAYEDTATRVVWYAERLPGGLWATQPVTPAVEQASGPSLVGDGSFAAIAYYERLAGDLRIAMRQGSTAWQTSLVDAGGDVGGYASLVGGPALGGFGIAYYDFSNADLDYAFGQPGSWTIETVDGTGRSVGRYASAVQFGPTPGDQVGIAYYDRANGDLDFALKRGFWRTSIQDDAGDRGGSIACGVTELPSDTVGFVYVDRDSGDLLYQWHAGTVTAVPPSVASGAPIRIEWRPRAGGEGRVRFAVPVAGMVRVTFYDAAGRTIAAPWRQALPVGTAEVRWDGHDLRGRAVPSGVLFVRVETPSGAGAIPAVLLH